MLKHAAKAIMMALLLGATVFAQGVAITQPLNGLVTTDVNQRVTYVFADPLNVDPASIILNVDGVDYAVGSPRITWTTVNFSYNVAPAWTQGTHNLNLRRANDLAGNPIAGVPLVTSFVVDLSGPYISARTPGVIGETEPFVTTNRLQPISIDIRDDWGYINIGSIRVRIDGVVYNSTSLGVTITAITGGYRFTFNPATAGVIWDENDWVAVELLAAQDSPDYGSANTLQASPNNAFGFFVDADGPECYPVDPVPFFRSLAYVGCSDYRLKWRVEDENGLDLSTFRVRINSIFYNWGDYRIRVDTLAFDGANVQAMLFTFTPNPQWYEGVIYTVYPPTIRDIHGNNATGWHWGAYPWTNWQFRFDNTGPTVSNLYPPLASTTRNVEEPIRFDVVDRWGAVDPATLHLIIRTSSGTYIEYTWWTEVAFPEIAWDGRTFTYYPNRAGITWDQGDTVTVTVWDVMDSMEFCPANHLEVWPVTWVFYVADGPMVLNMMPGNNEFSSCQNQPISFELIDPDGVNPWSVIFEVEGLVFDLTYRITYIDTHWVGPFPIVETTYVYPFVEEAPGRFALYPWLLPVGMMDYYDAREINCRVLAAEDALGHPMWGGPVAWRFWMDFSGPYPGPTNPPAGGITRGPYPVFSIDIYDEVCGRIDPNGVDIVLRGVHFNPLVDPSVTFEDIPGGGRVTVDCAGEGFYYAHGATVNVCLEIAHDFAQNRCTIWGNPSTVLPYCWSFRVDNLPPSATIEYPLINEITACPLQPIVIRVTDDSGVDPTAFRMIVNDVIYDWGNPRLTWDGTFLRFTPTTPYPEGVVTWTLSRIRDIAGNMNDASPIAGATFFTDYSAPVVLWTQPRDGEFITRIPEYIKVGLREPAGIDIFNTKFTLDVYTDSITFTTYIIDEATYPGVFTWDPVLGELWLDLEIAGLTFDFTIYDVIVSMDIMDDPDYACPDGNLLAGYQFLFGMNPGWKVAIEFWPEPTTMADVYHFGAFVGGTAEYDPGLDVLLPPPPPDVTPLTFLTPGLGTALLEDYRELDVENWRWRMFTGTQSGCIRWNPAALPALGSFVINGIIDMRGVSEYCFGPGELIEIGVTRRVMELHSGWNLVSVPVIPDDPSISAVFPMVNPLNVWEYNGLSYTHPTVVEAGHAYFILYTPGPFDPDPIRFSVPGVPLMTYTRTLARGWQTIGSVYDFGGVSFTDPVDVPDGSCEGIVYWLNPETGSYAISDKIVGGFGYWNLVLPPAPFASARLTVTASYVGGPKILPPVWRNPEWTTVLTFDDEGTKRDITIGNLEEASVDFDRGLDMPIPPALPGATFDVYVEASHYGRLIKDIRNSADWKFVVNAKHPVELSWDGNAPEGLVLVGNGEEIEISGSGSTFIEPGIYTAKFRVVTPTEFALRGAAPNPFNAACGIAFDLPTKCAVSLEVYDLLGNKISTIANGDFEAGTHRVIWNGDDKSGRPVASGVYLYKLSAGSFSATGRMVLVR